MSEFATPPEPEPTADAAASALVADHPLRTALNDEVHARPPEALTAPLQASFLACTRRTATARPSGRRSCGSRPTKAPASKARCAAT